MKTITLLTMLLFGLTSFAQPNKQCKHKEQIKAQKIAFLTNKLDLSVEEAQVFWPLYNEFEKKKDEIIDAQRNVYASLEKDNLSDKELQSFVDKYIELETAQSKLLIEYHAKFKKVLSVRKLAILYSSDRMFKKELLKQLRNCPNSQE